MLKAGIDADKAWQSVRDACQKTMEIYAPMLQHQFKVKSDRKHLAGIPFQILGLDLLLDQDLRAWILEVNDHPSLSIYFDPGFMGSRGRMSEQDIEEVDLFVKARVVKDTIKLAKKKSLENVQEYESLSQVYPVASVGGYAQVLSDLQMIFYTQTNLREKGKLSSNQFSRLADKPFF